MDFNTWMTTFVVAVSFVVQISTADFCDEGWKKNNNYCYYVSQERVTWLEARNSCLTMGLHLVSISNEEEQNFIEEIRRRNQDQRQNRPRTENVYSIPTVTSSNGAFEMLPSNGVIGNGDAGISSCDADSNHQEGHAYPYCSLQEHCSDPDITGEEHMRTDGRIDDELPGSDGEAEDDSALYAVVKKKGQGLTETELHDNVNYAGFME
ncbi:hypothetical protein LSH36_569g00041 [Paralvinella palmiformis]|uniref:C-type lectin domain-containing protein n=1 Tax=Paralvinella palmiformis TaxID=53620 RepID=A0AAD9MVA3_9ANNE|nr:hypothetical protein LSH36_569g00041 [Paralvinella palmiformis]